MPRKNTYEGRQKSIILNDELQGKLEKIRISIGAVTDAETVRFLINDYYSKNIERPRKK